MSDYHQPVMPTESIKGLVTDVDGIYVDATFGGGGHSRILLESLSEGGQLYAFDQDTDALAQGFADKRLMLIRSNFRYVANFLRYYGISQVSGFLADLGVSSYQIDTPEKGFSFTKSRRLDMRMNQDAEFTAEDWLNQASEMELMEVMSQYGEVRNAKTLARTIFNCRAKRTFHTVGDLLRCIETAVIGNKSRYLAQVFQAIRIKVNDELGALKALLKTTEQFLKPGGRLVIITYHSLEDRLVKHFMKDGTFGSTTKVAVDFYGRKPEWSLKPITKKPILPSSEEIEKNRRARSAKLRIAEKKK